MYYKRLILFEEIEVLPLKKNTHLECGYVFFHFIEQYNYLREPHCNIRVTQRHHYLGPWIRDACVLNLHVSGPLELSEPVAVEVDLSRLIVVAVVAEEQGQLAGVEDEGGHLETVVAEKEEENM